jgi:Methyltransferase domain
VASRSVLVFPAGMPPALMWARHATENGVRIVGASSLVLDPARNNYLEWISLPWIGDADFSDALGRCLAEKRIDAVFTPHPVVWSMLRELLPKLAPNTRLEPVQPWATELADYRAYREIAERFEREPLEAGSGDPEPRMPLVKLAALVRAFQLVPGQCDDAKLEALVAIFRRMPPGDVVEIGSLWGRSAVALAILSRHYAIGNLLCVDPWRREDLRQGIPEVDAVFADTPMDEIFQAFRINLAPFAGRTNYSRARSEGAAEVYAVERCFTSGDFGRTDYAGEIALLHIDGNHALGAVRADIRAWTPFVRPGGWIVFDDYRWPFGDGPRVAADQFLTESSDGLASAFVAGGALFAQLNAPVSST